jgi:hypothetical protein
MGRISIERAVKIFIVHFWLNVEIGSPDECWPWLSATDLNGYGMFGYNGGAHKAHRIAFTLTKGDIEKGKHVLHSCDNPGCCNPRHLYSGTNRQNHADKCRKGRLGDVGGPPKLDRRRAETIRAEYGRGGITQAELAAKHKVTVRTIQRVTGGHTWR